MANYFLISKSLDLAIDKLSKSFCSKNKKKINNPCRLFLPIRSAFATFRALPKISLKQKKDFRFLESLSSSGGRTRRSSRRPPVCSFHGAFALFRRHPCRLFLPIRSAFATFRALPKNQFKTKKRLSIPRKSFV